jgi:hypothetical protein
LFDTPVLYRSAGTTSGQRCEAEAFVPLLWCSIEKGVSAFKNALQRHCIDRGRSALARAAANFAGLSVK